MAIHIMLVVGCCDEQVFLELKGSVGERVSAQEATAVRFADLQEVWENPTRVINSLINGVREELNADSHTMDMVFVLDDEGLEYRRHMLTAMNRLNRSRGVAGVYRGGSHLLWLLEEGGDTRPDYGAILERDILPPDSDGEENGFTSVFLLSDKRSNNRISKNDRMNAAGLVLSAMMRGMPGPGLYSAGVGNLRLSRREISAYTRHLVRQRIIDHSLFLRGFPDPRELCAEAYDKDLNVKSLAGWLRKQALRPMGSSFCYILGAQESNRKIAAPRDLNYSELLGGWEKQMRALIRRQPFPDDAAGFFGAEGEFGKFVDAIHDEAVSKTDNQPVKVPLIPSIGRSVAAAYNDFIKETDKQANRCLGEFFRQWKDIAPRLARYAQDCVRSRNSLLAPYQQEPGFITRCEEMAGGTMDSIRRDLSELELDWRTYRGFFGEEDEHFNLTEKAVDELMTWAVHKVGADRAEQSAITDIVEKTPGAIMQDVIQPINASAEIYMALYRHGESAAIAPPRYVFFPEAFRGRLASLERYANENGKGYEMVLVANPEYLNVEQVSVMRLAKPDAGRDYPSRDAMVSAAKLLTAFVELEMPLDETWDEDVKPLAEFRRSRRRAAAADADPSPDGYELHQEQMRQEEEERRNPWGARVKTVEQNKGDKRFILSCTWLNARQDIVDVVVSSAKGERSHGLTKANYTGRGMDDVTDLVDVGRCKLEIRASGSSEVLGTCTFIGKQKRIRISIEDAPEIRLGNDRAFQRQIVTVLASDGQEGAVHPSVLPDLRVNAGGDLIPLPAPQVKRGKQTWQVVTGGGRVRLEVVNKHADSYVIEEAK